MKSYTYEIISVNAENNTMTIKYKMGSDEEELSVRLPRQDETLDELVQICSPFAFGFDMIEENYQDIPVGTHGTVDILETGKSLNVKIKENLPDYPAASEWAVQQLENKSFVNLRTERYYDEKARLVGLVLHGPTVIDPRIASTTMLSAKTFSNAANKLGVPFIMINDVKSYAAFSEKYLLGMKVIPLGKKNLIYRVWDSQMETAKQESLAAEMRAHRNTLLAETDWIHLPDATKPSNIAEWETYRQALRDITGQSGFPQDIQWPQKPA